jgi:DNA-binding CsgD family transcriptional regulator
MKTLCAGKTGREAMMCMHENHDKVSQACKDAVAQIHGPRIDAWRKRMEERRAAMEAAKKTCEPDMKSLCAGKTGREAMMCMHDNRDKVSQACKDAMAKVRHHHRHHHHHRFGHRWMHRGWMRGGPQDYSLSTGFPPPSPQQLAAMEAAKAACEPDMKSLCAGKTGRDAMMCMRENHDKVSQACKDAMAKARPHHGMAHGPGGPEGPPPPAH